jgi:hypothetical protein
MTPSEIDKRGILQEDVFDFQVTKANVVLLYYHNKHVKTLRGKSAEKFIKQIDAADRIAAQLLMAKVTGNFKRGNERSGGHQ